MSLEFNWYKVSSETKAKQFLKIQTQLSEFFDLSAWKQILDEFASIIRDFFSENSEKWHVTWNV